MTAVVGTPSTLDGRHSGSRTDPQTLVVGQYLLLGAVGLMWLAPVLWLVVTSVKPTNEVFSYPTRWVPETVSFEAYSRVISNYPIGRWFINSFVVATITTAVGTGVAALAAYPLARLEFAGRRVVTILILATFLLPFETIAVPLFLGLTQFQVADSYFGLAIPPAASAFNVFLLTQFFRGLPKEWEDAALVDGASHWRIWWQIVLPLSKPVLITVAIFTFTASWNNFFWPLIISQSDATRTVPVGSATLISGMSGLDSFPIVMAASVLSTVPAVIFFVMFQRYFVRGIATTGVKG